MTRLSSREILREIPEYPSAISAAILAINLRIIEGAPKTLDEMQSGLRKLEKRLAWLTAEDDRLAERRIVTQDSTVAALLKIGVDENAIPEEMSYLSLIKAPKEGE